MDEITHAKSLRNLAIAYAPSIGTDAVGYMNDAADHIDELEEKVEGLEQALQVFLHLEADLRAFLKDQEDE